MAAANQRRWIGGILALVAVAGLVLIIYWMRPAGPPGDLGVGIRLVQLEPAVFLMGEADDTWPRQEDEFPPREVRIPHPFYIGACEVTQAQWEAVMKGNPSAFKGPRRPVERLTWAEAKEFCCRLSRRTRQKVRLPTEAEWEYACRAGTTTGFAFGEVLREDQANFAHELGPGGGSDRGTVVVGGFPSNHFGIHDMHGNVWEWCEEPYSQGSDGQDSKPECRVARGGGWLSGPMDCRSASRTGFPIDTRADYLGFRIVVEAN